MNTTMNTQHAPCRLRRLAAVLVFTLAAIAALSCVPVQAKDASEITKEQFVDAVANVVAYARTHSYTYGDSRSEVPTADHRISCDRMIAKALYDLGFTDQVTGGITVGNMVPYLNAHGFVASNSVSDIGYGSIVIVKVGSQSYFGHTFVTIRFDQDSWESTKYDCGTQTRINSSQPFVNEPWYYRDEVIVFNIPDPAPKEKPVKKVTLNIGEADMVPGQTLRLSARVSPSDTTDDPSIRWSSSDPAVVTVSEQGVIRSAAPGTATITAASAVRDVKAVCQVRVRPIPVTRLTLNRSVKTLSKNHSYRLTAAVFPANATDAGVTWLSSAPGVVSVSRSGRIRALKKGTAVITARAGGMRAFCTVNVKYVRVQSIVLRPSLTMKVGKRAKLTWKLLPAYVSDSRVVLTSSARRIVRAEQDGTLTALKKGTARITVTSADGRKKASCVVTVQ